MGVGGLIYVDHMGSLVVGLGVIRRLCQKLGFVRMHLVTSLVEILLLFLLLRSVLELLELTFEHNTITLPTAVHHCRPRHLRVKLTDDQWLLMLRAGEDEVITPLTASVLPI
jgi:hypothetical protein